VNVSLEISMESVWLDHNRNHSLLEGVVTLSCRPTNIPPTLPPITEVTNIISNDTNNTFQPINSIASEDGIDNSTLRYLQLIVTIHKVSGNLMRQYHDELRDRLEYSMDATMHFEDSASVAFSLQTEVDVVDSKQVSDLTVFVTTSSHEDARTIKHVVTSDIFMFILQETMRDSHFSDSVIESIHSVQFMNTAPQSNSANSPSPTPTMAPSIFTITEAINEKYPASHQSFLKVLFTTANASDWFSFIGVLVLSIILCACCIGMTAFCCVHTQRTKTRRAMKYKQTQDDSDSDLDELQGMMHKISEHSDYGPRKVAKRIFILNQARNLKNSVQKRVFGHSDKLPNGRTIREHSPTDMTHLSHSNSNTHSIRSALSSSGLSSISPPKSLKPNPNTLNNSKSAIHPALSSAIETVEEMSKLKADSARRHNLVVSSTIMEEDSSDSDNSRNSHSIPSSSSTSDIDLEEEFIRIEDNVTIKNKNHQHQKYSSIGYIDDDDIESTESDGEELSRSHRRAERVFGSNGMMVQPKQKKQFRRGPKDEAKAVSTDSESDNVSELSEEETLQSIAAESFAQDL